MGKRGPAPKGEYAGKSQVLSTRIRPDTRAALVAAANRSGRSVSQEIEFRLRRSFQDDERSSEVFGSQRNRRLLQMVGIAMQAAVNPERPAADWLNDPVTFEIAVQTVNKLLNALRPPGEIPEQLMVRTNPIQSSVWISLMSMDRAATTLAKVQHADPSLPLDVSGRQHLVNVIKAELGPVADRPEIFRGTAADMRRRADELEKLEHTSKRRKSGK